MFEHMKIVEQVYEGETTSKTIIKAYSDRASHGRKYTGVESALPIKTNKDHFGKHKKNM